MTRLHRPAWAEIDLGAVAQNAATLSRLVGPARLCTVVKADGYGHGAVEVAKAALAGGAGLVGVALAEEAIALREAGVTAPVLLFAEPPRGAVDDLIEYGVGLTLYRRETLALFAAAAVRKGRVVPVHVKLDSGMHRLGADAAEFVAIALAVAGSPSLALEGLWTHLAVADEPDDPYTELQLDRFEAAVAEVRRAGVSASLLHAANSAGAIAHRRSRYDLVRCGIASYGYFPSDKVATTAADAAVVLRPVLSLKANVHLVRRLAAGERPSYGRTTPLRSDSSVAVVPLGYADGVVRRLGETGGAVLIGGKRRPIIGSVTMDQIIVDCGDDVVRAGDEVTLIGRQGAEEVSAAEWARRSGTIVYEVLCGIGPRVPRVTLPPVAGDLCPPERSSTAVPVR